MSLPIKVKRLPHAQGIAIPLRMSSGASGCDIAAAIVQPIVIEAGKHGLIPTGFIFEIPYGYEVQIRPRSGLALKHGIMVLNTPGTIDSDYRGEIKVILANFSDKPFTINRGDRIAQAVPMAVPMHITFIESEEVETTDRGEGGFGHSGL